MGNRERASASDTRPVSATEAVAEHILLQDDKPPVRPQPRRAVDRLRIDRRFVDTATEITIYAEGVLRVRLGRDEPLDDYLLETRFIDPRYRVRVRPALRSLVATALCCGLVLTRGGWLPLLGGSRFSVLVALLFSLAGGLALAAVLRRSRVGFQFVSRNGRIPVLDINAKIGGIRLARSLARGLRQAVPREPADGAGFLKAEMQAHYDLLADGTIDQELCSAGTSRILARFG